ncbi:MAG: hypothetical protein ACI9XJ_002110 [Marivirga sp.]|jgi:hypothetical protein
MSQEPQVQPVKENKIQSINSDKSTGNSSKAVAVIEDNKNVTITDSNAKVNYGGLDFSLVGISYDLQKQRGMWILFCQRIIPSK